MNVALLMPLATQRGGGELMFLNLLRHAPASAPRWVVIFFEEGPLVQQVRELGARVHVVRAGRLRQPLHFGKAVGQIARIARKEEVALIFSWSAKPHLYGSLAGLLSGRPSAWYQLGFPHGRHLSWIDRIATLFPARAVVALSRIAQRAQEALLPHRPVKLVYPSVDLARFNPERLPSPCEARRELGLPEDGPLIGMVGRLQRWKGMHVLVDAMPRVLEKHPEAHCVLVGGRHDLEPEYLTFLEKHVEALGLQDHVTLAGFQQGVPRWMQAMDIFVHASDHEPFGIVVLEAMALAKPVVAGSAGGPAEIITPGKDGLLSPYGDAKKLSENLLFYVDNPERARAMGRRARRRAEEFSPEAYAGRLSEMIGRLAR